MSRTVLIVDDIEFVRKTLHKIFTDAHYQVVGEGADGNQAVELYARLRPELVTLDVVMPKLSGIEAAKKIIKLNKSAKIIMISAMAHEHLLMEAINAGVRDYVMKPFKTEDILRATERVLNDEVQSGNKK